MGKVPEVYGDADWSQVRSPAIREWCIALDARAQRLGGRCAEPNWQVLGHGLLIIGPVGTGKSSAAALVCQEAARLEKSIRWSYVPDLADAIAQRAQERQHEIRLQEAADLLVWDDFGVRDLADWEIGYLDQIVETRYRARKPMVVTTNWTGADLRSDPRLARMVDRWRERTASMFAVLGGESMRNKR
jgi:DNA replication protein DnaC